MRWLRKHGPCLPLPAVRLAILGQLPRPTNFPTPAPHHGVQVFPSTSKFRIKAMRKHQLGVALAYKPFAHVSL